MTFYTCQIEKLNAIYVLFFLCCDCTSILDMMSNVWWLYWQDCRAKNKDMYFFCFMWNVKSYTSFFGCNSVLWLQIRLKENCTKKLHWTIKKLHFFKKKCKPKNRANNIDYYTTNEKKLHSLHFFLHSFCPRIKTPSLYPQNPYFQYQYISSVIV